MKEYFSLLSIPILDFRSGSCFRAESGLERGDFYCGILLKLSRGGFKKKRRAARGVYAVASSIGAAHFARIARL